MTKKIIAAIAFLGLSAPLVSAAPAAEAAAAPASADILARTKTWLTHLEDALTQSALSSDYQKGSVAQAAAVRGAKQTAADPNPVWKGGFADEARAELRKERAALAQGVGLLVKGGLTQGRAELLAFVKDYPQSPFLGAAQEALKKIDALSASSAAAQSSR
ncbi:MAG: hypothetical protein ACREKE_04430 [bacterium]